MLYTSEIQGMPPSNVATSECFLSENNKALSSYALRLIEGAEAHRVEIDALLAQTSENWSVARMPVVDRCILRLAVFEMCYVDEVPVSVSINEAVELAKGFGGEDESPRFVNGVLGRIAALLEEKSDGKADDSVTAANDSVVAENSATTEDSSDDFAAAKSED